MDANDFTNTNANIIIKQIYPIKRNINEILKNKIYNKNFTENLLEQIYEIDDLKNHITVEVLLVWIKLILEKTDLYKSLKPILSLSDMHFELKEICSKVLESLMTKIKEELFQNFQNINELRLTESNFNK